MTYLGNFQSLPHCSLCSTVRRRAYLPRCRILHRRFAPSTQHRSAQPSAWRARILLLLLCAGPSARTTSAPPIYTHTPPLSLPEWRSRSSLRRRCRLAPLARANPLRDDAAVYSTPPTCAYVVAAPLNVNPDDSPLTYRTATYGPKSDAAEAAEIDRFLDTTTTLYAIIHLHQQHSDRRGDTTD